MADHVTVLDRIHKKGYWRILFRPLEFHVALLHGKGQCEMVFEQAQVRNDRRAYPLAKPRRDLEGKDWIAGESDCPPFIEYWRFYESGQFVYHLAMEEEHMPFHPQFPSQADKLNVPKSIEILTDMVEFAARLSYHGALTPAASLSFGLHGAEKRVLIWPNRATQSEFRFRDERVQLARQLEAEGLTGRSKEIALDLAVELFAKAGWNAERSLLSEEQDRHISRRPQ